MVVSPDVRHRYGLSDQADTARFRPPHGRSAKLGGKPCIRGYRFSVEHLLALLAADWTVDEIQPDFPFVEPDDVRQVVNYAAAPVDSRSRLSARRRPGRQRGRCRPGSSTAPGTLVVHANAQIVTPCGVERQPTTVDS
jgi:uncharacterized protein (DUF433 family)